MSESKFPDDFDAKKFFKQIKTIAVVGYSDKQDRAGHYVAHYLDDAGYDITAINPKFGDEINGLDCLPNLEEASGMKFEVIDIFRAPKFAVEVVKQAAQMNPKPDYIVFQPGAESEEGSQLARDNGMMPLEMCMMAMHKIWAK